MRSLLASLVLVCACGTLGDGETRRPVTRPWTLGQAMRRLDRSLGPVAREQLRSGAVTPTDLHHGFGAGLRSGWGLWGGSPLSRWFNRRGIFHPDDMSSIILDSYVHRLRGEPIRLREQIRGYKKYWRDAEMLSAADAAEGPVRGARIRSASAGWTHADAEVQTIHIEPDEHAPSIAKLERYQGGFLVFMGRYLDPTDATTRPWHAGVHAIARANEPLVPVVRAGCRQIHDAVTLGGQTTWLCRDGDRWSLQDDASTTAVDVTSQYLRLGTGSDGVFLYDRAAIYLQTNGEWRPIRVHRAPAEPGRAWGFALSGAPPRRLGDRFYFADGGELHLLGIDPPRVAYERFAYDWGTRHFGPWSLDVYAVEPAVGGGLWLTIAHDTNYAALVRLHESGRYEVPIMLGSVDPPLNYSEGLLMHPELPLERLARQIPATCVFADGTGVYLGGTQGIAEVHAGRVSPVVRFSPQDGPQYAEAAHALGRFGDGSFILGFRGVHTLERAHSGRYTARAVEPDDGTPAPPIAAPPGRSPICGVLPCADA